MKQGNLTRDRAVTSIRLAPAERAIIAAAAKRDGVPLTTWIRARALEAADSVVPRRKRLGFTMSAAEGEGRRKTGRREAWEKGQRRRAARKARAKGNPRGSKHWSQGKGTGVR